jgi:dienelactone hydrolase
VERTLAWLGATEGRGVCRRRFEVVGGGRRVPGLLWEPLDQPVPDSGRPLVLLGHGGSGHKEEDYIAALARRLVRHHGFAATAIDGPVHGDRRPDEGADPRLVLLEFSQAWSSDDRLTDAMTEDWQASLDLLERTREGGGGPVAYWGLSMGTILGLPLVAADRRIVAAVLGLMGMTGPTSARIAHDAPAVRCPVLFLMQLEDELFPRETAIELFDALGSTDKRLHAHPGAHGAVPVEEFDASEAFLAWHLSGQRQTAAQRQVVPEGGG